MSYITIYFACLQTDVRMSLNVTMDGVWRFLLFVMAKTSVEIFQMKSFVKVTYSTLCNLCLFFYSFWKVKSVYILVLTFS